YGALYDATDNTARLVRRSRDHVWGFDTADESHDYYLFVVNDEGHVRYGTEEPLPVGGAVEAPGTEVNLLSPEAARGPRHRRSPSGATVASDGGAPRWRWNPASLSDVLADLGLAGVAPSAEALGEARSVWVGVHFSVRELFQNAGAVEALEQLVAHAYDGSEQVLSLLEQVPELAHFARADRLDHVALVNAIASGMVRRSIERMGLNAAPAYEAVSDSPDIRQTSAGPRGGRFGDPGLTEDMAAFMAAGEPGVEQSGAGPRGGRFGDPGLTEDMAAFMAAGEPGIEQPEAGPSNGRIGDPGLAEWMTADPATGPEHAPGGRDAALPSYAEDQAVADSEDQSI